jgi:hypothetical protein
MFKNLAALSLAVLLIVGAGVVRTGDAQAPAGLTTGTCATCAPKGTGCFCVVLTLGGPAMGSCVAYQCLGTSFGSLGGGGSVGLDLAKMALGIGIGQVLSQLLSGQSGGGGDQGGGGGGGSTLPGTNPLVTSLLNGVNLTGTSTSTPLDELSILLNKISSTTNTVTSILTSSTTGATSVTVGSSTILVSVGTTTGSTTQVTLSLGSSTPVVLTVPSSTTTVVRALTNTSNLPAPMTIEKLCTEKPWRGQFVTKLFTPQFFDSLCEQRGFGGTGLNPNREAAVASSGGKAKRLTCPAEAASNTRVTVTWDCKGSASGGRGFPTRGLTKGSTEVLATTTRTYYLKCGDEELQSCVVAVRKPILDLTAVKTRIAFGGSTELYWSSSNMKSCTLSGPLLKEKGLVGKKKVVVSLVSATYTLTCLDGAGISYSDTVVIRTNAQ